VWRPGVVDVVGDRIVHAGPLDTAPPPPGPVRQLPGVVVPGLVNAHAHSAMTLLRGVGDGMALEAWLEQAVWPREAHLSADDVYWGTSLGCAEMLRCGVTTTTETYFHDQAVVDAVVDAGMRAVVTPGILDVAGPGGTGRWQAMLDRACALHAEADGRAGLVRVGFGPHAAYSLPPEGLVAVARAAQSVGALVSIHLAETAAEGRALEETYRRSVPALLADLGVFDGPVVAAHGVWLSDDDLDLLARHRVAVAHCPQSNAKLGSGVARLTAMLAAGLAVAIGTDGPASNDDLDLWEELRLAALLARLQAGDPAALSAGEALALATRGGAEALGLAVGCIEAGRLADLVHLRVDDPRFVPLVADDDLVRHLVWSSSSHLVTDVWVAGRQVVVDGRVRTVDVPRACREVQARALRLADAVGAADRPPGPTTGRP
jgi:5-methylthioadenosine/S-adenosylhomocysteine deaminase